MSLGIKNGVQNGKQLEEADVVVEPTYSKARWRRGLRYAACILGPDRCYNVSRRHCEQEL